MKNKLSQKHAWSLIWSRLPSTENACCLKYSCANPKIWSAESICPKTTSTPQKLSSSRVLSSQAKPSTPGSKSETTLKPSLFSERSTYHSGCLSAPTLLPFSSSTDLQMCSATSNSLLQVKKSQSTITLKQSGWSILQRNSGSKHSVVSTKRPKSSWKLWHLIGQTTIWFKESWTRFLLRWKDKTDIPLSLSG